MKQETKDKIWRAVKVLYFLITIPAIIYWTIISGWLLNGWCYVIIPLLYIIATDLFRGLIMYIDTGEFEMKIRLLLIIVFGTIINYFEKLSQTKEKVYKYMYEEKIKEKQEKQIKKKQEIQRQEKEKKNLEELSKQQNKNGDGKGFLLFWIIFSVIMMSIVIINSFK